jgi:glycosyltransferase involved in cell wall biosynthesis
MMPTSLYAEGKERSDKLLMTPSVSVIIPTYNREQFILAAIESVISQTFKDLEIIVVDDGSTDDTQSIVETLKDNRIIYIRTDNKGPAHARNVGMRTATRKYIAFLDSDDLYLPDKLELQVSFLEAHPELAMLSTEAYFMLGDSLIQEKLLRSYHRIYDRKGWSYDDIFPFSGLFTYSGALSSIKYYSGYIFSYILQGPVILTNTIIIQRDILKQVGYQNEAYFNGQEYEFVVRICKDYQVGFIDFPTYVLRYHNSQISMPTAPKDHKRTLTEIRIEKVFLQTVLDWGYNDKEYYERNKTCLNHRIAELYHCIGEKWLFIGERKRARENFRAGHRFDASWPYNLKGWCSSFLPTSTQRGIAAICRRTENLLRSCSREKK